MVGRLELGRGDVAAGTVETLLVPPGHPGRGGVLDLVVRPPGALGADELDTRQPTIRRLKSSMTKAV